MQFLRSSKLLNANLSKKENTLHAVVVCKLFVGLKTCVTAVFA